MAFFPIYDINENMSFLYFIPSPDGITSGIIVSVYLKLFVHCNFPSQFSLLAWDLSKLVTSNGLTFFELDLRAIYRYNFFAVL